MHLEIKNGSPADSYATRTLDVAYLRLETKPALKATDARPLRGFFGRRYSNRTEFHHHGSKGLIYEHPLIQYKVIEGDAVIAGMGDGAYLVAAINPPNDLSIYKLSVSVTGANLTRKTAKIGLCKEKKEYRFLTPWLSLNSHNKESYDRLVAKGVSTTSLFDRILIGNLLSLSKAVRYDASEQILVETNLIPDKPVTIKQGVELLGFTGTFTTNFDIPKYWGIGKSSARGFGVVVPEDAK